MNLNQAEITALIAIREYIKYRRCSIDLLIHNALMHCDIHNIIGPDWIKGLEMTRETLQGLKQKDLAFETSVNVDGRAEMQFRITEKAKELIKSNPIPSGVVTVSAPVVIPPLYNPKRKIRRQIGGPLARRWGVR